MDMITALLIAAYPQTEWSDETLALWEEKLQHHPFELVYQNINKHIDTSEFVPKIANAIKPPQSGFYDNHIQLANQNALQLEEARKNAVPMPEYIRRELIGDE